MTEKEIIRAEIERRYKTELNGAHSAFRNGRCEALREVLDFINSMQKEPKDDWKYSIAERLGISKDEFDKMRPVSESIDDSDINCDAELCFAHTGCKYYNPNKKSNVNHCIGGMPLQLRQKQQMMKNLPIWKKSKKLIEGALLDRGILYIPRYMIELSELKKLPKEE